MAGKVLSVVNMKGGVGKTTISVALAESLAVMAKRRVLVIDLDAQASCTYAFLGRHRFMDARNAQLHSFALFSDFFESIVVRPEVPEFPTLIPTGDQPRLRPRFFEAGRALSDLVTRNASALKELQPQDLDSRHGKRVAAQFQSRLDLLAAVPELQILEREILYRLGRAESRQENPEQRIAEFFGAHLDKVRARYDFVVVDCPPGISAFTAAAIADSDVILAPVMPDFLSELGLEVFADTVIRPTSRKLARSLRAFAVLNRVQALPAHDQAIEDIKNLVNRKDDALALFPVIVEQAQEFQVASSGAGSQVTIREKYGSAIPTLEDMVSAVLEITEPSGD